MKPLFVSPRVDEIEGFLRVEGRSCQWRLWCSPYESTKTGGRDRRSLSDRTVGGEEQVDETGEEEEGGDMEQGRYGLDGLRKTRCLHNLKWVLLRACMYSVVWTLACDCCMCRRAHCCISRYGAYQAESQAGESLGNQTANGERSWWRVKGLGQPGRPTRLPALLFCAVYTVRQAFCFLQPT